MEKHWREQVDPFFEELLPEFERNLQTDSARLDGLLQSGQLADLGRIAHNYKGTAGYFGLTELGRVALNLDAHCKAGDSAAAAAAVEAWLKIVIRLGLRAG